MYKNDIHFHQNDDALEFIFPVEKQFAIVHP